MGPRRIPVRDRHHAAQCIVTCITAPGQANRACWFQETHHVEDQSLVLVAWLLVPAHLLPVRGLEPCCDQSCVHPATGNLLARIQVDYAHAIRCGSAGELYLWSVYLIALRSYS